MGYVLPLFDFIPQYSNYFFSLSYEGLPFFTEITFLKRK